MLDLKKWWSRFTTSARSPGVEALPVATEAAGLQYLWLLPGDVTYCLTPSSTDPKASQLAATGSIRRLRAFSGGE